MTKRSTSAIVAVSTLLPTLLLGLTILVAPRRLQQSKGTLNQDAILLWEVSAFILPEVTHVRQSWRKCNKNDGAENSAWSVIRTTQTASNGNDDESFLFLEHHSNKYNNWNGAMGGNDDPIDVTKVQSLKEVLHDNRRKFLQQCCTGVTASMITPMLGTKNGNSVAYADEGNNEASSSGAEPFQYQEGGKGYGYQLTVPSNFEKGGKPVKTHLNEVNFNSNAIKGYQYGITVDPVRINSIVEFGTPSEVAARVVTAELNRDGILDVTMGDDPSDIKDENNIVYYLIDYISDGKRGKKHLYTKTVIHEGKLYVLTGQIKVIDETPAIINDIKQTLKTFSVVTNS